MEIKTESYGAAHYKNGGWCKHDVGGVKIQENKPNLANEKAAMMAIKEQSAELERYETSGPKSGIRNVFKKFPFLEFLRHEDQMLKKGSCLFEETSKPDFIDYGLPSYSEATLGVYSKKEADETDYLE